MKSQSTAMSGVLFTLAFFALPPLSSVEADIFTKVMTGPGGDSGNSRGVAFGDYDVDGFIDLVVPQVGPGGLGSASPFLYHNNGDGTFSRVTNGPVAEAFSFCRSAVWGDYDNNGYPDLIMVNRDQPNYLFRNDGNGSFVENTDPVIKLDIGFSTGVSWVDYDMDGHLDLFRTTSIAGDPRHQYHNNRDGSFTSITEGDPLTVYGVIVSASWGDYNNDGRPDLFLPSADGSEIAPPNYLYRNDGGGTFTRVAEGFLDGDAHGGTAVWGDYDNDGDLDLFVGSAIAPGRGSWPNHLYRNDGNDVFTHVSELPTDDPQDSGGASSGCNWGDYDNDGWLDLFVANRSEQNDYLYHNNGNGTFTKVLDTIAVQDAIDSVSAAWGDYDNDGFLDLFVGNFEGLNLFYHNNGNLNHWVEFRLIGTRSNRSAIGAKVRVHATINGQSFWQMREVTGGEGFSGQNSPFVHFGLGNATNIDLVRIEWPSGTVQELRDVAIAHMRTVTEPGGEPRLSASVVGGQVQLTLTGKQGSEYEIGASTDLINWDSALRITVTDPAGTSTFPPPGSSGEPRRFYRAALK